MKLIATGAIPRFIRNPAPMYMYAMPTVVMWGSRPARLSFIHCLNTGSKQPAHHASNRHTRQTSPFVRSLAQNAILAATLLWPIQDRCVFVMNAGPALKASLILAESVTDGPTRFG